MRGPRHVVIVGRDASLWICAAAIRNALAPVGVNVVAVELPTRLCEASVHATLPAIVALQAKLGIDEVGLLRTTGGSFSLGWNIRTDHGQPFFLAHGSYGAPIDGRAFFPFWVKARKFGLKASFEEFSPTAMAARHGRVLFADEATEAFGRTDYGYHLPALAYAATLKALAIRAGVESYQATSVAVERDGHTGSIKAIVPVGGKPLAGDLFVDASGPEAVLIGSALNVECEDWRPYFPFDQYLIGFGKRSSPLAAYAELKLFGASWTALHATELGTHVVHARRSSNENAADADFRNCDFDLQDVAVIRTFPAIRKVAWRGNCVAIGSAACEFDPLFDLELHATQLGLVHLLSLFPTTNAADAERAEYNRVTRSLFERLRDFQAALYVLGGYSTAAPATLVHKLDIFRARGAIAPMEDETFAADQWRSLSVGMGIVPESWSPAIDKSSADTMKASFRNILSFVREKVLQQPSHEEVLARITRSQKSGSAG